MDLERIADHFLATRTHEIRHILTFLRPSFAAISSTTSALGSSRISRLFWVPICSKETLVSDRELGKNQYSHCGQRGRGWEQRSELPLRHHHGLVSPQRPPCATLLSHHTPKDPFVPFPPTICWISLGSRAETMRRKETHEEHSAEEWCRAPPSGDSGCSSQT